MERSLTIAATALAIAPAFYLAGWFISARQTQGAVGSDRTIAAGYAGLLAGFAAAVVGILLVWILARRLVQPGHLRVLQIADVVLVAGWVVAWNRTMSPPARLEYDARRAVLQIEVRVADTLLGGRPATEALAISFLGGTDLDRPRPEELRTEAGFAVLPWETTPIRVRAWEIRVAYGEGKTSLFRLDLPKRPASSTEWSGWIAPASVEEYIVPPGLSLRYRFLLVPYGQ